MERPVKALVTGATGFLGGALARRLAAAGVEVVGTGRDEARGWALEANGVRFQRLELTDAAGTHAACAGVSVVFHCGALSAPWGRWSDFYCANVLGTHHVIEACREAEVTRLIHVSTPSLYFSHADREGVREGDPFAAKPINRYVRSKRWAEALVARAVQDGFPAIVVRPRAVFGPGDRTILPRAVRALERGRMRVLGDGTNRADFTYIDNAVEALMRCMDAPALGRAFNVTDGAPVRLWDVVNRLCDELGLARPNECVSLRRAYRAAGTLEALARLLPGWEPLLTRATVSALGRSQTLDVTAARRELGYRPRVTTEEGVRRFARWWRERA